MNTTREEQFWLTVRIGGCQRRTETDGKLSGRAISLRDCLILSNSLKGENHPARGDEIELGIYEADSLGEEVIGSFDTLAFVQLSLPPAAFAEFWTASAAADGAARDITIQFKSTGDHFYAIMKVQLVEHMPEGVKLYPKAPPVRVHPVVAELRDIQRKWTESWRGTAIWFFAFAGFASATYLLVEGLRALWGLVKP